MRISGIGLSRVVRLLITLGALAMLGALALAGQASAKNEATTCTGPFGGSAVEIIVPAGETCTLEGTATVTKSVRVEPGASLIDQGASVGKDIKANKPAGIQIGAVKQSVIGHDVRIDGLTGSILGGDNYVCNAKVGHDVKIEHSAATASTLVVGDAPDCSAGVEATHDIKVHENANKVDVSSSSAGHDIHVDNNTGGVFVSETSSGHDLHVQNNSGGVVVSNNTAGHNAKCKGNKPSTEGEGNTQSKGRPKGCPSPPGPPVVKKVNPDKGPTAGGTEVTITGVFFTGAESVKFGANEAVYKVENDSTITATSPAGTGKVSVTVTTPQGTSTHSGHFEYKNP